MAVLDLVLVGVWVVLVSFVRGAIQYRRTGSSPVRLGDRPGSSQWWARFVSTVGVVLAIVTAIEVAIYYFDLPSGVLVASLLIFAVIKFVLVGSWFMHLKFDSKTYARFFVMGLASAITLFLIVLLTSQVFSR